MTKKASSSKVQIDTPPQLVFKGDFQQDVIGEIKPGSNVAIIFDAERLPLERSLDEKGKPAWTISAFYKFLPGGEVNKINLLSEKSGARKKVKELTAEKILKGVFSVPSGSEEAVIWFLNTGNSGHEYYDSALGNNYRFRVLPEVVETASADSAPVKKPCAKRSKV
jgi:hypothetical protein